MDFLSDGNLRLDNGARDDEVILILTDDGEYLEISKPDEIEGIAEKVGALDRQIFTFFNIRFTICGRSPFDFQSFDSRKKIARAVLSWLLQ